MKSVVRMSANGTTIDGVNANHIDKASLAAAIKTKLGLKA